MLNWSKNLTAKTASAFLVENISSLKKRKNMFDMNDVSTFSTFKKVWKLKKKTIYVHVCANSIPQMRIEFRDASRKINWIYIFIVKMKWRISISIQFLFEWEISFLQCYTHGWNRFFTVYFFFLFHFIAQCVQENICAFYFNKFHDDMLRFYAEESYWKRNIKMCECVLYVVRFYIRKSFY